MKKSLIWIWGVVLVAAGTSRIHAQILKEPHFDFEFASWGDTPSFLQSTFGFAWLPDYGHGEYRNMGSGRDDVFPLVATIENGEVRYFVLFEFTQSDSALVSVTMLATNFTYMLTVPEEFLDYLWDMNLGRFGEPTGGKWIPLIGESKEWMLDRVAVKMIRMYLPSTGVLVKYVLQEGVATEDRTYERH